MVDVRIKDAERSGILDVSKVSPLPPPYPRHVPRPIRAHNTPSSSSSLSSLSSVQISLVEVPERILRLTHLSVLDMSHCQLQSVPERLGAVLVRLTELRLAGNLLDARTWSW
jgi:Leucine-rich repeat (LRR) protein